MSTSRFVVCIRNDGHEASLECRKIHELVPDALTAEHQQLRVIDESGEDYLYPAEFLSIDLPASIVCHISRAA